MLNSMTNLTPGQMMRELNDYGVATLEEIDGGWIFSHSGNDFLVRKGRKLRRRISVLYKSVLA